MDLHDFLRQGDQYDAAFFETAPEGQYVNYLKRVIPQQELKIAKVKRLYEGGCHRVVEVM